MNIIMVTINVDYGSRDTFISSCVYVNVMHVYIVISHVFRGSNIQPGNKSTPIVGKPLLMNLSSFK